MDSLSRNLRYAWRMLLKNPASSLVAIVAMALGISLTSSMYSIIDGILLRGLPFDHPQQLLHLERNHLARGIESMEVPHHDLADWQAQQTSFEGLAGFSGGNTVNLSGEGELPERYNGSFISSNFLDLLRVKPLIGRGFEPGDAEPGAPAVILLGHHVWQKRYGGDPSIVGKEIRANSKPTTVIGVMPSGFRFPLNQDVWLPLVLDLSTARGDDEAPTLEVFGRLRDGITLETAASEMATIADRLARQYPESNAGISTVVKPYIHEYIDREQRTMMGVMFAAVVLVLLIACINVANILAGRASLRSRELAIRSALGSGRWQLVMQVLAESALIAVLGAGIGLVLTYYSLRAFDKSMDVTNRLFWFRFELSPQVLLFTAAVTALAAVVASLLPALQVLRPQISQVLQDSPRGSGSARAGRLSRVLVVTEVAISCALLVGSLITVRSVLAVNQYDLRIDPRGVLSARVGLFEGDYPTGEDQTRFFERVQERLLATPGVRAAAISSVIPADTAIGGGDRTRYQRSGETYDRPDQMPSARLTVVSPGYFGAFGLELLAGRDFTGADRTGSPAVALVNEDFARREWPDESPIGQRINLWRGEEAEAADPDAGWVEVVGLVPDLRFADFDNEDDQQAIYIPLAQSPQRFEWIIVKTAGDPLAFTPTLRQTVLGLDPDLPLYFVRDMDQVLTQTLYFPNLLAALFTTFGAAALVLACVGLYGVMAFAVARRTQEMGVRMAFGARARDVVAMVLRQGLFQTSVGLIIGLPLGLLLALALRSAVFSVRPMDPITFATVALVLLAVTTLACLVPAKRAAKVSPIVALRYD